MEATTTQGPTIVQLRTEDGELLHCGTIAEALRLADERDCWKISFAFGGERVRLVREGSRWVLRMMQQEMAEALSAIGLCAEDATPK